MTNVKCPNCGSPNVEQIDANRFQCPYCGTTFNAVPQPAPQPMQQPVYQQPQPAYQQPQPAYQQPQPGFGGNPAYMDKNRTTAGVLALLLGGLGIHQFYLGHTTKGIIYLVLCCTYIPGIIGFIEGIMLLMQKDEEFYQQPALIFK